MFLGVLGVFWLLGCWCFLGYFWGILGFPVALLREFFGVFGDFGDFGIGWLGVFGDFWDSAAGCFGLCFVVVFWVSFWDFGFCCRALRGVLLFVGLAFRGFDFV